MAGKDATLESIRVSVRKLEKAVEPINGLTVRLAGLERRFGALELRVGIPRAPEPAALALDVAPPAALPGEDIAETIKAAMGEFTLQIGETIRDALAGLIAPPPARPKNGAPPPMVSDDLGLDGRSVVAFEQTKG